MRCGRAEAEEQKQEDSSCTKRTSEDTFVLNSWLHVLSWL